MLLQAVLLHFVHCHCSTSPLSDTICVTGDLCQIVALKHQSSTRREIIKNKKKERKKNNLLFYLWKGKTIIRLSHTQITWYPGPQNPEFCWYDTLLSSSSGLCRHHPRPRWHHGSIRLSVLDGHLHTCLYSQLHQVRRGMMAQRKSSLQSLNVCWM